MAYESLPEILYPATELVRKTVDGELSFSDFVNEYGNFYHYNALDGHEAIDEKDRNELAKYKDLVAFHEAVQTRVVDQFYPGPPQSSYDAAGRLSETPALTRLRELAEQHCFSKNDST